MTLWLLSGKLTVLLLLSVSPVVGFEPLVVHCRVKADASVHGQICLVIESEQVYRESCWTAGDLPTTFLDYTLTAGQYKAHAYALSTSGDTVQYTTPVQDIQVVSRMKKGTP